MSKPKVSLFSKKGEDFIQSHFKNNEKITHIQITCYPDCYHITVNVNLRHPQITLRGDSDGKT